MNDFLEFSPTANEATQKCKHVVKLLSLGRFNLTKFVSNDPEILQQIEQNSVCQSNDGKQLPNTEELSHVLCLKWNHHADTLMAPIWADPGLLVGVFCRKRRLWQ